MNEDVESTMDIPTLGIGLAVGIAVGVGLILLRNHLASRGPELLTRRKLKEFNLPSDKLFSTIFQKSRDKRIEIAKEKLKEVERLLGNIDKSIESHSDEVEEQRRDLNIAQNRIEMMETEGEKQVTTQSDLMPIMHKFSASLSAISDDVKSFWSYFAQKRFLIQVERGHDRKTVEDIMMAEFDDIQNRSKQALSKAMGALEISSKEYHKVSDMWLK